MLPGKVREPREYEAQQVDLGHWRWPFEGHSLLQFWPVFLYLLLAEMQTAASQAPAVIDQAAPHRAFSAMMDRTLQTTWQSNPPLP